MTCTKKVDIVLKNGIVYTVDDQDAVCEALAIREGRIVFTGSNSDVERYISTTTKVIDLAGNMVLPGLIDSHIHPPGLALLELYEVQLFGINSLAGYLEAVRNFLSRNPKATAIYGRGWSWERLAGEEAMKGPRKEHLDAISAHIPIILRANDGHTLWVNSAALNLYGITCETQVPQGGVMERHSITGELWGTLKESAMSLLPLADYSSAQYLEAMAIFQRKMHSHGITSILCLSSVLFSILFQTFETMGQQNSFQLRVRGAMTINPIDDVVTQLDAVNRMREAYQSDNLTVTTVKFFADGVIEGATSCLLEPYLPAAGQGDQFYGQLLWDDDNLKYAFRQASELGLQIHVHSTGDAATKQVLDALEYAQSCNPLWDGRNVITHLQLVDVPDIERFKRLNIIANVQPYWHFKGPGWWQAVDLKYLGDRAQDEFPLASFFRQGVIVASSSDYPATQIPNPFSAMQIGVTRNLDNGSDYGVEDITNINDERYLLKKEERADIGQMLRSFTINNAYSLFLEKEIGSIEVGKRADLVVIDQDIFTINPLYICKTKVLMTFFDGQLVYESNGA